MRERVCWHRRVAALAGRALRRVVRDDRRVFTGGNVCLCKTVKRAEGDTSMAARSFVGWPLARGRFHIGRDVLRGEFVRGLLRKCLREIGTIVFKRVLV